MKELAIRSAVFGYAGLGASVDVIQAGRTVLTLSVSLDYTDPDVKRLAQEVEALIRREVQRTLEAAAQP